MMPGGPPEPWTRMPWMALVFILSTLVMWMLILFAAAAV